MDPNQKNFYKEIGVLKHGSRSLNTKTWISISDIKKLKAEFGSTLITKTQIRISKKIRFEVLSEPDPHFSN